MKTEPRESCFYCHTIRFLVLSSLSREWKAPWINCLCVITCVFRESAVICVFIKEDGGTAESSWTWTCLWVRWSSLLHHPAAPHHLDWFSTHSSPHGSVCLCALSSSWFSKPSLFITLTEITWCLFWECDFHFYQLIWTDTCLVFWWMYSDSDSLHTSPHLCCGL